MPSPPSPSPAAGPLQGVPGCDHDRELQEPQEVVPPQREGAEWFATPMEERWAAEWRARIQVGLDPRPLNSGLQGLREQPTIFP